MDDDDDEDKRSRVGDDDQQAQGSVRRRYREERRLSYSRRESDAPPPPAYPDPSEEKALQKEIKRLQSMVQDLKSERNKEQEKAESLGREVNRLQSIVANKVDDYDPQSQGTMRRSFREERKYSYSRKQSDTPSAFSDPVVDELEAQRQECSRLKAELAATRKRLSQTDTGSVGTGSVGTGSGGAGRSSVNRENTDDETGRLRQEVRELRNKLAYSDLQLVQGKDFTASLTDEASNLRNEVKRLQEKLRESTLQRTASEECMRAMRKESANLRRSVRELEEKFAEVERKFGSFTEDD